jgi:hypothetical protein
MKMSIVMSGISGLEVLKLLEVSKADINWLADHGIGINVKATELELASTVDGVPVTSKFPVKVSHWSDLKSGQMATITKKGLQLQMGACITTMKKKLLGEAPVAKPVTEAKETLSSWAATLKGPTTVGEVLAKKKQLGEPHQISAPMVGEEQMMTMEPVKLRDATHMYQPVKASSSGSRYFLVAACAALKVGVRYKDGNLSVRLEGPQWSSCIPQMTECGFTTIEHAQAYASMHVKVNDMTLARKTLGAILAGLNVHFYTPYPDLEVVKDKGN